MPNRAVAKAQVVSDMRTKDLVGDATVTDLFNLPLPQNTAIGGTIRYTAYSTDATDFQARSGIAMFAAVNKAGTVTTAIIDTTSTTVAASTGTFTLAWTAVENTTIADTLLVRVQPTSSLTETVTNISFTVLVHRGVTGALPSLL